MDLCYTDPAKHRLTAGSDLDNLSDGTDLIFETFALLVHYIAYGTVWGGTAASFTIASLVGIGGSCT